MKVIHVHLHNRTKDATVEINYKGYVLVPHSDGKYNVYASGQGKNPNLKTCNNLAEAKAFVDLKTKIHDTKDSNKETFERELKSLEKESENVASQIKKWEDMGQAVPSILTQKLNLITKRKAELRKSLLTVKDAEKLYHLFAINEKTNKKAQLTSTPTTHEKAMIIKSKQTVRPETRYTVEEV